ncbi:hypothetical protein J8C06_12730 [Chloracidobacterium validum]|uniref:Oligosaccharide repeat unit polymerase n=1 Tax=Chloracidobacterium validum TaxID=2821543 RepID=A0ABX8BD77_9BACT|nr:hypothetical protein [Chloracidobacterium validum]QUW04636.1 hypothetical protein J8C06_12730 [Chloracidobacterium validum]
MDTLFPLIVLIQSSLLIFAIVWFFRRNDELPLMMAGLTMFFSSYRYFAVTNGWGEWVETVYTFGLPPITDEDALEVLPLIAFGEFVLMATYCARMRQRLPVIRAEGLRRLPARTVSSLLGLGILFFFLSEYARSAAFVLTNSSYVYLFPLTLVGVATLLVAAWRFGALETPFQKAVCVVIVAAAAYNNFGAFLRFQFVGLVVGIAVALSVFYAPRRRAVALLLGAVVAVFAFSLGGAVRQADDVNNKAAAFQRTDTSWERLIAGEDANMLDGFVIVRFVYPELMDFTLGVEHFEILTRPIPRALWPDKPVGGYVNKLGLRDESQGMLGISQSIYGSFYGEGGVVGIAVLAVIYGMAFAAITEWMARLHPFVYTVLRGLFVAWMIPLLRGGDLPGIYAWLGMSSLTVLVFAWSNRRLLKQSGQPSSWSPPKPLPARA